MKIFYLFTTLNSLSHNLKDIARKSIKLKENEILLPQLCFGKVRSFEKNVRLEFIFDQSVSEDKKKSALEKLALIFPCKQKLIIEMDTIIDDPSDIPNIFMITVIS